jgi:hypothetical protein
MYRASHLSYLQVKYLHLFIFIQCTVLKTLLRDYLKVHSNLQSNNGNHVPMLQQHLSCIGSCSYRSEATRLLWLLIYWLQLLSWLNSCYFMYSERQKIRMLPQTKTFFISGHRQYIVESLQSYFILTMSHWSSGLPVCFPSQGTRVQNPWGGLTVCETGILLLALSRYIGDPDVIDHCGLV